MIASAILLSISSAAAAAAAPTSLDALFQEAWTQSPAVLRARADVEAAQASLAGASVWFPNPEIESAFNTDAPFANEGELDFDVGVAQELSWPGGRFARVAAGESSVTAARARLVAARLDAAANVERAVGDVIAAREAQRTRAELLRVAQAMAESARRRLEAGSIGALEASLVAADAASGEASVLFAQADVSSAESALCQSLGRPACDAVVLEWPVLVAIDGKKLQNVDERLDVRAAHAEKAAADRRMDAASLAWLPSVRIGAGYAYEQGVLEAPFFEDAVIDRDHLLGASLSITLPLWDWRRQDVLAARADVTRAEADARESALRARSGVPAAFAALEAATAAVERLASVQADIARGLADIERAYEAGAMALDEAMTSRDRLLKARLDSIEANRRRVAAHADVLRALSLPLLPGVADVPETP